MTITAKEASDKCNLQLKGVMKQIAKALDTLVVIRQVEVYEPTAETIDRLIELGYSVHPKVENQLTIVSW